MPTVQELYQLWADTEYTDLKQTLAQSLEPRCTDLLFQRLAELEPEPGQLVADIGSRDAAAAIVAYVTLATARLEPRELEEIAERGALDPASFTPAAVETAAGEAGLTVRSVEHIGSEWRRAELVERYGQVAVDTARNGFLWGVYQLIGKLCPTIYVWERRG